MLLQSTPDKRPTGRPGRGHLALIPSHLLQLSQTSDPPAVPCCRHLLGTGAGQRGALRRAQPTISQERRQRLPSAHLPAPRQSRASTHRTQRCCYHPHLTGEERGAETAVSCRRSHN